MSKGKQHCVKKGDCISSIAEQNGLFWETVWQHGENSQLREKRDDPNVLLPGDMVFIPDKVVNQEICATGQRHSFVKLGVPAKLNLKVLDNYEVQSNEPYELIIDGVHHSGSTDANGNLEHSMQPKAKVGRLTLTNSGRVFELELGGMDPISEQSGVIARLENLGYDMSGSEKKFQIAVKQFQSMQGLEVTGKVNADTKSKLLIVHGS